MLEAVENCAFDEDEKLKYIASTTHLEVQKGILASKNAKSRSICYKREFAKLPTLTKDAEENRIIGRYFDVDAEGNIGANKGLIEDLRKDVLEAGSMMTSFTASWNPQGVEEVTHGEYLEQFGKSVREDFTKYVKEASLRKHVIKNCIEEAAIHLTFCATRANTFYGREELVRKAIPYVKRKRAVVILSSFMEIVEQEKQVCLLSWQWFQQQLCQRAILNPFWSPDFVGYHQCPHQHPT